MREGQRANSIAAKGLTRAEVKAGILLSREEPSRRPRIRGDCVDGDRPCPWVGCKYHLYLDVMSTGTLKFNFPDKNLGELEDTCALDIADRGGVILEDVGQAMNLTRERIRQIEAKSGIKLYRRLRALGIDGSDGFYHLQSALGAAQEE